MSWISQWANKAEIFLTTLDNSAAEAFNANRNGSTQTVLDNTAKARSKLPEVVKSFVPSLSDQFDQGIKTGSPTFQENPTRVPLESIPCEVSTIEMERSPNIQRSIWKTEKPAQDFFDQSFSSSEATKPLFYDYTRNEEDKMSSSGYETYDSTGMPTFGRSPNDLQSKTCDMELDRTALRKKVVLDETIVDTKLENKLLQSEVSSLNQEVSNLLKRNHKLFEENKQLLSQVERLSKQLRDSDSRVRELQVEVKELSLASSAPTTDDYEREQLVDQLNDAQYQLQILNNQLDSSRKKSDNMESNLLEARRQNEIAQKRAELAQKETTRVIRELAEYKEKATHILTMKEKLINSIVSGERDAPGADETDVNPEMVSMLRAECDMLREEVSRWRIEVDHRELAAQELEVQMQAERESFRRNLDLMEQQAEREKQLREDADSELVQLRRRLRECEDSVGRQKAEWHVQLTASEAEVARLRQALDRRHPSTSPSILQPGDVNLGNELSPPTRTDQKYVFSLESRLRQLSDNLLSKQDALDSVLAQNHALKIRLERAKADNESLASALSTEGGTSDIHVRLPYQTGAYGCARLALHNSPVPRPLRPIPHLLDDVSVRLTNLLRRWPLARLLFFIYITFLHLWLLWAILVYLPPVQPLTRRS